MKEQWKNPEMTQLNIVETKEGAKPSESYDATTYDAQGKWWGSSQELS